MLAAIAMTAFSRSNRDNKFQQLNSSYFKASGTSAKALDTLHAYGISMSQKTAYRVIDTLADKAQTEMKTDFKTHSSVVSHDNMNVAFRVYEQRLGRHSRFDSGTAATVYIINDENVKYPDNRAFQEHKSLGYKNPLNATDIHMMEQEAAPRLRQQAISTVLSFLTDAPAFAFSTYEHREDSTFATPIPVFQLPIGAEHATRQYMLKTMKIDEASLQGNEDVMNEVFRQLGIISPEEKRIFAEESVLVWVGDQLTVVRIRGVKKNHCADLNSFERFENVQESFGWFHLQINLEHNLHAQYFGKPGTAGSISEAAVLLKRKGLHATSVQGTFHHDIREALLDIVSARFRDLWCFVGDVDRLGKLRDKSPAELLTLATRIVDEYGSTASVQGLSKLPPVEKDDIRTQDAQWNRDLLDYITLDRAIRSGDVGLMELLLPRLLYRFLGGGNSNYVTEILETLQGLRREWTDELK